MSNELKSVLDAAMRLSEKDRATLLNQLLDAFSETEEETIEPDEAFLDELDRRAAEGLEATEPWEAVRDRE